MRYLFDAEQDLPVFGRNLAEAVAWCADRATPSDAGDRLWTPSLRPRQLVERPTYAEIQAAYRQPVGHRGPYLEPAAAFEAFRPPVRAAIVAQVVSARSRCLKDEGRYPNDVRLDVAGGRLLLFDPEASLADGAAEDITHGFFDGDNLPAWDTWVAYSHDSERYALREELRRAGDDAWTSLDFVDALVSWVPPALLEIVDEGIEANPDESIKWADTVNTRLTRALRRAGLLSAERDR